MTQLYQFLKHPPTCTSFPPNFLDDVSGFNLRKAEQIKQKVCWPSEEGTPKETQLDPKLLDLWTLKERAFWVEKPGKDSYFLHDIYKKHTPHKVSNMDPRFQHKEKPFYRSFKYEFDCVEEMRLAKLQAKIDAEEKYEEKLDEKIRVAKEKVPESSCLGRKPFWWRQDQNEDNQIVKPKTRNLVKPPRTTYSRTYQRWFDASEELEDSRTDPCRRRDEWALVGQQFRSEACNWYYKNYPPPNVKLTKKFSK